MACSPSPRQTTWGFTHMPPECVDTGIAGAVETSQDAMTRSAPRLASPPTRNGGPRHTSKPATSQRSNPCARPKPAKLPAAVARCGAVAWLSDRTPPAGTSSFAQIGNRTRGPHFAPAVIGTEGARAIPSMFLAILKAPTPQAVWAWDDVAEGL